MIRVDYIGLCWLFLQLVNCVGFWTAWIVILICVWVWFVFCNVTGWHRWGIHSHTKYHLHHFSRENNSAPNIDFNFNRKPFPWHLFTTDFAYVAISAFHGNPCTKMCPKSNSEEGHNELWSYWKHGSKEVCRESRTHKTMPNRWDKALMILMIWKWVVVSCPKGRSEAVEKCNLKAVACYNDIVLKRNIDYSHTRNISSIKLSDQLHCFWDTTAPLVNWWFWTSAFTNKIPNKIT